MADFKEYLIAKYPSLAGYAGLETTLAHLVSQDCIQLPKAVFSKIQNSIHNIDDYIHSDKHLEALKAVATDHELQILSAEAPQKSILSAYDFHYDLETEQLSLIEINTNASAFLVTDALYKFHNQKAASENPTESLKQNILHEYSLFHLEPSKKAFIIDEDLDQQKMFFEFFMYKDFLSQFHDSVDICDYSEIKKFNEPFFIYNRYCDFLLEEDRSQHLLDLFLSKQALFSPNPKEYLLAAAKDRLSHFSDQKIDEVLIPSIAFKDFESVDTLWAQRKKYYFKPMRMYGAKAVFRGSSISKKRFNELDFNSYMAQESRPPGIIDDWKFDLRVYTYGNEILLIGARRFKGQLLNFSTPGGGITRVEFS